VFLLALAGGVPLHISYAASSAIAITPLNGIVGTEIAVTGQGFAPNSNLTLKWGTDNVSWTFGGNPTETTGIDAVPVELDLGSVETNSTGSFTVQVEAPIDNGGKHVIQMYALNGTALPGEDIFTLEPSFSISSGSGAAGSPLTIFAHGLGIGTYSTNYHVMWDNKYVGYMTAVTTHGEANATIYAVGSIGVHYIDIYQGYPGAGYLNPDQNPSSGNWYPPYLPFQTTYTITSEPYTVSSSSSAGAALILPIISLCLVGGAFILTPMAGLQKGKDANKYLKSGIGRLGIVLVVVAILVAGVAVYGIYYKPSSTNTPSSNYVPEVSVVRPEITVPQTAATTGPRISVTPNVATVGSSVNVTGLGFSASTQLPVSWSTRVGNNLNGFQVVNNPLRNVTTTSSGSFSFLMQVPSDLEGDHFVSVGNLTTNSNATLYIERSATVTPARGPVGTEITIQLLGTGWDFNNNIVVIDYDNSYIGYACGFNSQGNITVTIPAAGSPGLHSIDLYPSIYLGPQPPSQIMIYRYPILTPYDHPEKIPSFHFSFLITTNSSTTIKSASSMVAPSVLVFASLALGTLYLASTTIRRGPKFWDYSKRSEI
jgi:hypothetical protein